MTADLETVTRWFQKAIDTATKQGRNESALLWSDGLNHLIALNSRVAELEAAFRRYAIHDETCDQEIYGAESCNCGYREVLLSLKP